MSLQWIKPPWQDEKYNPTEANPEGFWPWCGDPFLAALQVNHDGNTHWEYSVLTWTESGLVYFDSGESFDAWSSDDIEWIASIPAPPLNCQGILTKEEENAEIDRLLRR